MQSSYWKLTNKAQEVAHQDKISSTEYVAASSGNGLDDGRRQRPCSRSPYDLRRRSNVHVDGEKNGRWQCEGQDT